VPGARLDARCGLLAPTADSVIVVRRWWRHWIVGTTDAPVVDAGVDPEPTAAEVDELLGAVNRWLARPLTRADVVGAYAGLRPLLDVPGRPTAALSRGHVVRESVPGLITVVGGKYTTYRVMAAEAIDAAMARLGRRGATVTDRLALLGADGYPALRRRPAALAAEAGLTAEWIEHLLDRHGSALEELLALVDRRPELARPLPGGGYLEAEVVHAVGHEAALHLDDVLERRTHAAIEQPDGAAESAPRVAELMAGELGWDDATRATELATHHARMAARRRRAGLDAQRWP
jgi:glycerol-3-phosphate dehydrogenase